MKRRTFLKAGGAGIAASTLAASTLAAPAVANQRPEIKWRCASSFPKSLDILFGAAEIVADRVKQLTDEMFQIRIFAGGEIVPGLQVLDAVQAHTVECGHTVSYYYVGKDPTLAFDTAVPFGLTCRMQNAWMYHGGGLELMREIFKPYNIVNIPCGNTGTQMGGWFSREIKSVADLQGLKMRIAGFAGQVMAKLGVIPQQLAGSDVYPALEKGTIDAVEWIGPYDDEKLGFYKVAKYYYYPGWWEAGPQLSFYVNASAWESLPKFYQEALLTACAEANIMTVARYDAENPPALRRLVANGTILKPFPRDVLEASYKASFEIYDETAKQNPNFKKVYEAWKPFRDMEYEWFSVAEHTFDRFAFAQAAKG